MNASRQNALLVLALIAALESTGCEKRSDQYQTEGRTWSNLELWGEYIKSTHEAGINLETRESPKAAADYLKSIKATSDYEYSLLVADAWGRPFHWKVFVRDGATVIKIISDGKDGISQDGGGDDLFIEVFIPKNGPITSFQNTPKHPHLTERPGCRHPSAASFRRGVSEALDAFGDVQGPGEAAVYLIR